MHFKFNINLTDKDYLDYNIFWMLKSPYGKKQIITFRIVFIVLVGAISILSLCGGGFSKEAFIGIIPYFILLVILQIALNPFFVWVLKGNMKALQKKGKMGYSPVSEMEFYDNSFLETTPTNKTEQTYTSVERISILADKVIYIHVNNVMSYIIPITFFNSKDEYNDFLKFIKTKCSSIDTY